MAFRVAGLARPETAEARHASDVLHAPVARQRTSGRVIAFERPATPPRDPRLRVKRLIDIVGACVGLIVFSPLMLALIMRVRSDGGPAMFVQPRVGQAGEMFDCYKFRSMMVDAEGVLQRLLDENPEMRAQWDRDRKLDPDPRVTPLGDTMRRTSLDELPQFWNVLKGDMSLVGPRPIMKDERAKYRENIRYYDKMRPGITGLWQTSGRSDLTYDERVDLDVEYAENWSIWNDVKILFKTVYVVIARRGAK